MKKIKDFLTEYLLKTHEIKEDACWDDNEVLYFAKSYAMHVASEQDKITRHSAAEIALSVGGKRDVDEAHRDIMNLQTKIKELP